MEQKPRLLVSKCIEFAACRYNGQKITSPEVRFLQPHVNFIPVCPEMEIGLPVPRDSIRLVQDESGTRLVNSETGENHTEAMTSFRARFLDSLEGVDGCILKGRSPTCGIGNVKVYPSHGKVPQIHSKETGLFGKAVLERFPEIPVEDEGRLNNLRLREHFLTRLFTLHAFNLLKGSMGELVDYHSKNKYLFMSYSQKLLREAGKLTANHEHLPVKEVYTRYRLILSKMFDSLPRIQTNINVLQHLFGYVSKHITKQEKELFLDMLERYRELQIPLAAVTSLLQSWIVRFDTSYLAMQTYFQPFPKGLQSILDTGKGRV